MAARTTTSTYELIEEKSKKKFNKDHDVKTTKITNILGSGLKPSESTVHRVNKVDAGQSDAGVS